MWWILTWIAVEVKTIWCKIKGRRYDEEDRYFGTPYMKEGPDA